MIHQACLPLFLFNNAVFERLIFRIFNYTYRLYFQILEIFFVLLDCPVKMQNSVFQMRNPIFSVNYLVNTFSENLDVPI